jgi:hypothetical protein
VPSPPLQEFARQRGIASQAKTSRDADDFARLIFFVWRVHICCFRRKSSLPERFHIAAVHATVESFKAAAKPLTVGLAPCEAHQLWQGHYHNKQQCCNNKSPGPWNI